MTDTSASFEEKAYLQDEPRFAQKLGEAFRNENFLSFEPPPEWALGYAEMRDLLNRNAFLEKRWIKLQVTGPGTVWSSFFSRQSGKNLSFQIQAHLRQILIVSGLAQIQRIRLHGRNPLIVIDDPLFLDDLSGLQDMVSVFRRGGAKVGLHFCSSPTRLETLQELELDLLHFDLHLWNGTSSENLFLDQFLKQGKWVAWGIIPTSSEPSLQGRDFSPFLLKQLEGIQKRGWSLEKILQHSLLAPACGTGSLTPERDRRVTQDLSQAARQLKIFYFLY